VSFVLTVQAVVGSGSAVGFVWWFRFGKYSSGTVEGYLNDAILGTADTLGSGSCGSGAVLERCAPVPVT